MIFKKNNLHAFLIASICIASCFGQNKTKPSDISQNEAEISQKSSQDSAKAITDYVVEILEDKKGQIWIGSVGQGAARFDGKNLRYFTTEDGLVENTVVSMKEDNLGNIWFGTHAGVSKYDGVKFTNYATAEGIHGPGCQLLFDKKGELWAATNAGVFRFDGATFKPFPLPNPIENPAYKWEAGKVWNLIEDSKGSLWFARDGYGVCRFDGKKFTHLTQKDGLYSNAICGLAEDKLGNMWIGSLSYDFPKAVKGGGLSRYDGKTIQNFPTMPGLHENDIYHIHTDKADNVWITAIGLGIYRYDGEKFTLFDTTNRPDLIQKFAVQSFLEDSRGRQWFGFSGGLFLLKGQIFEHVSREGILRLTKS